MVERITMMFWSSFLYFGFLIALPLGFLGAGHAILYKREVRAALSWAIFCLVLPFIGPLAYWVFGINRIQRKANRILGTRLRTPFFSNLEHSSIGALTSHFQGIESPMSRLAYLVDKVVQKPLLGGNTIELLMNGDEAFPAMCQAIEEAKVSITMCSYIFDNDRSGKAFCSALGNAVQRDVEVRVLIDDMGRRYSLPTITQQFQKHTIRNALFLPARVPWQMNFMNLRNHRKSLIIDGKIGFTGGMNIREGNLLQSNPKSPIQDLHFRLEGPVVHQLQEVFAEDWAFTTNEILSGIKWFPELSQEGPSLARGIPDGPDEDFEKIRWTLLGALNSARESVRILTPYFLPDAVMVTALNLAAMRGVKVEILLPEKNNLPFMNWATMALAPQLLNRGCTIYVTPPPFDHSKLVIVDQKWTCFGSANWDPRSLRLNFELNVECYDQELAQKLTTIVHSKIETARKLDVEILKRQPLPKKLRNGIFRLFSPYL